MKLYGLVGYPLGHSFSARYFDEKFRTFDIRDIEYRNFPLEDISMLPEFLAGNPGLKGFNVTIPYKEAVIPFLSSVTDEAKAIGAVNCIKVTAGGLIGYNTDAAGFRDSLLDLIDSQRPDALVLGTGGASKAVRYVLDGLGIKYKTVSRTPSDDPGMLTYGGLDRDIVGRHRLIINTTPLGTYPDTGSYPEIPYEGIGAEHLLFDLVYNPEVTEFMKRGLEQGAHARNGYGMLAGQAEESWTIWNGGDLDEPDK